MGAVLFNRVGTNNEAYEGAFGIQIRDSSMLQHHGSAAATLCSVAFTKGVRVWLL